MNTRSISMNVEQQGMLTAGPFFSSGTYTAGAFPKVRLELTTELGGLTGRLEEVCDGQVVWTARQITGLPVDPEEEVDDGLPPGTELLVSRRDIDLISDALAESPQSAAHILAAELGVGGIPGLLAGLQQAFEFRAERTTDDRIKLTGRWRPDVAERLGIVANQERIPTEVELFVRQGIAVPEQLTYFRTVTSKAGVGQRQPILVTRFSDVTVGHEFPAETFRYVPPSGIDVVNKTPAVVSGIQSAGTDQADSQ